MGQGKVDNIIRIIAWYTIWITPLTFTIGLIYSIKKPEKEAAPYKIIAVISAYLIMLQLIFLR
jgi:hypothetical protein